MLDDLDDVVSGEPSARPLAPADWSLEALTLRLQVAEAFARFGVAYDQSRVDVLVECFTADAAYRVATGHESAHLVLEGRHEITSTLALVMAKQRGQRRHQFTNVLVDDIDLAAGTATATAYALVTVAENTHRIDLGTSAGYVASVQREGDGCWRFSALEVRMDVDGSAHNRSAAKSSAQDPSPNPDR